MITIKQIESPVVVTDGVTDVNLYAGQTYTCEVPEVNEWFEMEIDTRISGTSPSDSFQLKMDSGNIILDKGDSSPIEYHSDIVTNDPRLLFQYAVLGVYTIRMKGWGRMSNGAVADADKITRITNFGKFNFKDGNSFLYKCSNVIIEATDELRIETFRNLCRNAFSIVKAPIINNPSITNYSLAFSFTKLNDNLGYLDIRSATTMASFALGVTTWSTPNYNASLMGFLRMQSGDTAPPTGWILKSNVSFHGGSSIATGDGLIARNYLINTFNWTITDSTP